MKFKYTIREILRDRGISQRWLADQIDAPPSHLSVNLRIPADSRQEMKYSWLVRISKTLDLPIEELHYDHQAILAA